MKGWFAVFLVGAATACAGAEPPRDSGAVDVPPAHLSMRDRHTWPTRTETAERGAIASPGVAIGDLDGDGDLDVLATWTTGTEVFLNDGTGALTDAAADLGAGGDPLPARAVALADVDGDGDLDAFLGRETGQPDVWLTNDGTGRAWSMETLEESGARTWSAALGDLDGDGDLDLYNATWDADSDWEAIAAGEVEGGGHGIWERTTSSGWEYEPGAVPDEVNAALTVHAALVDADADADLDVYMGNDFGAYVVPNRLLLNDGGGRLSVALDCGCDIAIYSMGVAVGDANGDGAPDLYVSNIGSPRLLLNAGDGTFYDATLAFGGYVAPSDERLTSWGTAFVDLDLDGDDDVVTTFGPLGDSAALGELDATDGAWTDAEAQVGLVLENDDGAALTAAPDDTWDDVGRGRVVAVGDLDGDQRPDLVAAGRDELRVWLNDGGGTTGLTVRLQGPRANVHGLGARVVVEVGDHRWTRWMLPSTTASQSALEVYAGLRGASHADRVEITWPDGTEQVFEDVEAGVLTAEHPGR